MYGDFKNLTGTAASGKILCDKTFNLKKTKYDGYQSGLAPIIYKFFGKKPGGDTLTLRHKSVLGIGDKNENMTNE